MNKKSRTLIWLLAALLSCGLLSCKSVREFTYFQDTKSEQLILKGNNSVHEYKVKPYDNLYINIKTLNPDVNALFDTNGSSSGYSMGTSSNYGDHTSQYINGYQVDSTGTIILPIIGSVEVKGLTLNKIQEKILNQSLEFLKDPTIKVKLLSFKVNVSGEIRNPGVYYSYNEKLTILEAISLAGGVTDNAKVREVLVIRPFENGNQSLKIDLSKKSLLSSEAYYLQPNDFIYIKPNKNKKTELNSNSYSLFLSTITTLLLIYNIFKK